MKRIDVYRNRAFKMRNVDYQRAYWTDFNFSILHQIMYIRRPGKKKYDDRSYSDCIMMLDTETSKNKKLEDGKENHVVIWTLSIRAFNHNIVTLWGRKPSECILCVDKLVDEIAGEIKVLYIHNLSYDWVFLRKFFIDTMGEPKKQLNTKPHYPVYIEFNNGLILKDSLILSQRRLEKWADDLDVEHKKAVGYWDYNAYRNQNYEYSEDELHYAEFDTLAGVECIQKTMDELGKRIYSMPLTATGIPREQVRERAGSKYHEKFLNMALTYEEYQFALDVYHGGYTHNNRHEMGWIHEAICKDFASSYPYWMLVGKYPMEKFIETGAMTFEEILKYKDEYAFMIEVTFYNARLKDDGIPMPYLQYSKCLATYNDISDNGRILCATLCTIRVSEMDLDIILDQYDFDTYEITKLYTSKKDYLPRWFTDYVYECFKDKTMLKGGDPTSYALAKAKLNSLYGMCVQRPLRDNWIEDYQTGQFTCETQTGEEDYDKYINRITSILPYQWGMWVTIHAAYALFKLSKCIADDGLWLYSDTDSIYATKWDDERLKAYNNEVIERTHARGYEGISHNGRLYYMGLAETDGVYSEFKGLGSKRYSCRDKESGKLKITVAGVPKSGVKCLDDNIDNFKRGLIFRGAVTGKLQHTIVQADKIHIDEDGNEVGDSIDLSPCDYLLDEVNIYDWQSLFFGEMEIREYE